jgi:hypothetical protein
MPLTIATGPGFEYNQQNVTGNNQFKLDCASDQVYCKIFDSDNWLQCTDPVSGAVITFTGTFHTKSPNEKIGVDLNVTRSGYTLGTVFMKGGPGGIQYRPPNGTAAATWGRSFYTATCNGINKGISNIQVCLNRQNFTGGGAPPAPPPSYQCNVVVEEFNFETPGQCVKWSNSKTETHANFTTFLGRFTQGANSSYTFTNIPRDRKKLILEFDLYEIDDWEAGQPGQDYSDILYVSLNRNTSGGVEIPLGSYNKEFDEGYFENWYADIKYSSRSYGPPTQLGFGPDADQRHKVIMEIPNRFIRPDNTINIGFRFQSTENDEFAGFDNIKLTATCDDAQLAPTSAPTRSEQRRNDTLSNSCGPGSRGDPNIVPWNCNIYSFIGKCDLMVSSSLPSSVSDEHVSRLTQLT